ncbi:MAG: hypothetical protein HY791_35780 [Deltaproteobacteria bacterium]|nr:hypothetical protein [Deltaproteobacteria bacterium]
MSARVRRGDAQKVLAAQVRKEATAIAGSNSRISKTEERSAKSPLLKSAIAEVRERSGRVRVDDVVDRTMSRAMAESSGTFLSKAEIRALAKKDPVAGAHLQKVYDILAKKGSPGVGAATNGAKVANDLAALLKQDNAFVLPSPIDFDHANEFADPPSVEVVTGKSHAEVFEAQDAWIRDWWKQMYPKLEDMQDGTVSLKEHVSTQELKSYLNEVVAPGQKAAVNELMKSFKGEAGLLRAFDYGSEIIGTDALILTPKGSDSTLVVRLTYVHA